MNPLKRMALGIVLTLWCTLSWPQIGVGSELERLVSNTCPRRPTGSSSLKNYCQTNDPSSASTTPALLSAGGETPVGMLKAYQAGLDRLRSEYRGVRQLPDVHFFLFGMGPRRKMMYMDGQLRDALTGEIIRKWDMAEETIVPPAYGVFIKTREGKSVEVREDEEGVWLVEGDSRTTLARSRLRLPTFSGNQYASILRVLHQEVLINVINGQPVPNYFVYSKPWYRDGAMMGMVLKETGNLSLIKDWILGLREPFDRNNAGETEADNLGQVLHLVSLVSDKSHPIVKKVQGSFSQFKTDHYINGRSDFAFHPVYQTKWAKFGLKALGIDDPYEAPLVKDSYSSLFWWDYKDKHVRCERFDRGSAENYPYLVWAEDHFYGEKRGLLGNRDYPLSWEANASQADYKGMSRISPLYGEQRLSLPHTWHAAEMFLLLLEARSQ